MEPKKAKTSALRGAGWLEGKAKCPGRGCQAQALQISAAVTMLTRVFAR
jgi:hypothetical protein